MRFSQPFRAFVSLLTILCFSGSAFSGLPINNSKNPFVILIQENHSDPGAQKQIAELIHYYQSQMNVPLLAVEGASGEIPVEALRKFPDSPAKRKSIEILMDQLILDGASAAAMLSPSPVRFIGVEDPDLYQKNLKVFREVKNDSAANEFLNKRRKKLNQDFRKISPGLKKFYEAGDDFGKLLTEQPGLRTSLTGNALPVSKIYSADFLLDHPEIRQKLAAREFEKNLTIHSLLQLRERWKQELIITDFDRRFDLEKTEFEKLENISNLKAVREDLGGDIPPALSKAREFYDLVRERDTAMAENLIRNLRTSAILVTGGFHTAGIARILRSKGISCRIVTPKTAELSSNDTLYERRLAGDLSVQTLAAPRAIADSEFRRKLVRLWEEKAVSAQAIGKSLGAPVGYEEAQQFVEVPEKAAEILEKMYPSKNDRYITQKTSHGIFMETDIPLIESALNELKTVPGMKVLDLGAGDGRVPVAAALRGLEASGIEGDYKLASRLDSKRRQFIRLSKRDGVGKRLHFEKGDFYKHSFSGYDIVFYSMGGTPDEEALEEKIIRELKPGARFVVLTHVPTARPLFENLEVVPLSPSIQQKERLFQIYQAPVSVELPDRTELTKDKWAASWNRKLAEEIITFTEGGRKAKKLGPFEVSVNPARDLKVRPKISDFRGVPQQNLFPMQVGGRHYWLGVNAFPSSEGHGMIYENLSESDAPSAQLLTEQRLADLLAFQMRYPFFKFFFNAGPKAGASVKAYHAQSLIDADLPIEHWFRAKIFERTLVKVSKLVGYPGTAIVFEGGRLNHRAILAGRFLDAANKNQIPYNVLVGADGAIYLFLRDPSTERKDIGALEHAGSFKAQNWEAYHQWKSEELLRAELAGVALKETDFKKVFGSVIQSVAPDKSYASFTAEASSLGGSIRKILIVIPNSAFAKTITDKINAAMPYKVQIVRAAGIEDAVTKLFEAKGAEQKPFDMVVSWIYAETHTFSRNKTALELLKRIRDTNPQYPFLVLRQDFNRDKAPQSLTDTLMRMEEEKADGFLGFLKIEGHFIEDFRDLVRKLDLERAPKEDPKKKKEPAAPASVSGTSSRRLSPQEAAKKDELKKQIADAELQEKAEAKVAEKLKQEAQEAARKKEAASAAALDLRYKAMLEEEAAEAAAALAEKQRAQVEAAAIEILEDPVLPPPAPAETMASDESTPAPPLKWGQGSKGEVGEERPDSPPVAGASLGKVSLNQANRAAAWFNRADRVEDNVVFLVRKQTLAELTNSERNELNYHLSQKSRRLLILHDRGDKNLNLFGLEGQVQHWWGSAEDYVQVLRRVRAPHVVYLSGADEKIRFQESGVVNVKHALFAPTAAVEYLFQGQIDFYGIWKKENGRLELMLSEKVEMLFREIAARRWMAVSA